MPGDQEPKPRAAIIGRESILGRTLAATLSRQGFEVMLYCLRDIAEQKSATRNETWRSMFAYSLVFWCGAVTNPSGSSREILNVNFDLPREAILTLQDNSRSSRLITFGSAFEGKLVSNKYLDSKHLLASWISEQRPKLTTHIRTHTLIGPAPPAKHMFLSQLFEAIQQRREFVLGSPGSSRQYITYKAFAEVLQPLTHSLSREAQIIQVGGAREVSLFELAIKLSSLHGHATSIKLSSTHSWEGLLQLKPHDDSVVFDFGDSMKTVIDAFQLWIDAAPNRS